MDNKQDWEKPQTMWLGTFKSPNTIRPYFRALLLAETLLGKSLGEMGIDDMKHLVVLLKRQGLSDKTINSILSAISSFYKYVLVYQWEIFGEKVIDVNPVAAIERPVIQPFGNLDVLNLEQARALIEVGVKDMMTGRRLAIDARNFTLLLTFLLTGQHNSIVRQLRWGQLRLSGEKIEVQWEWGNAEAPWHEFPKPVFTALQAALEISGRLVQIKPEDFVFVALEAPFEICQDNGMPPLSERMVLRIIQKYAKRAGLKDVTVLTLRHTFTALMMKAGARPKDIQRQLGLAHLDMTNIYLKHLNVTDHNHHWQTVSQMLGIPPEPEPDYPLQRNHPTQDGSKQLRQFRRLRK